ncbi:HAMP domain-containing protein [Mobilitalea sibirica]|uniref:histidine kinase n=1 Tax=Mobilitalea sibirica TaxID=1462919 RepID=A0A8J7KXA7_9FIRM|nr:ATP-binding protein [Mobilitalea sibirica]MBH1941562.1 HAMP domain-containing protein [Mobilitalea sibirica]
MAKENKVRIYNRLFFKLYLNYAVMLLVTAVLIGLIFMKLYEDTTMRNHKEQLEEQAERFSAKATEYIITRQYDDFLEDTNILYEMTDLDIWTIPNPTASKPMDESMITNTYKEMIDTGYVDIINRAFSKSNDLSKLSKIGDDEIYGVPMITVARPVYGENLEIVGAVLLKLMVEGQKKVVADSMTLIVFSSVVALAISFVIVIVFATELSLPISRMRVTALELASGDYNSKTGIKRNDEIGDLAKTVDILSEKLLENDIQRKNLDQMRLDFFANVSHELRTPITVMRAYTETLVDGVVKEEDKLVQYYDRMLSECKTMERLVGDLLLLSKMQNPDFAIEKEPVNLVQVFDDIIRSAGTIAEKKKINIKVTKESPAYMILGDYDRLRQMFMVILDNAIKFSDENKTVHINLSKTDKIKVSIRDEGIGIDESEISNIFEKFYKSNLRQNAGGSGLGLAIAKQIAQKHGSNIEVSSAPGEGTEFSFIFSAYEMDF